MIRKLDMVSVKKLRSGCNGARANLHHQRSLIMGLKKSRKRCTHCGKDSKSTPMMRRGPSGPRSPCNACGLFWANRGTLRDLSKKGLDHLLTPIEQDEAEANDLDSGTVVPSDSDFVGYTDGHESALIAENGPASGVSPANGYHGGS